MEKIRIAIGQIDVTVGDIKGNCVKMAGFIKKAREQDVDIISFPELSITGYHPEDLLLRDSFIQDNLCAINSLKKHVGDIIVVTGFVDRKNNNIYNSAAILYGGKLIAVYHKNILPDDGVFNDKRYFTEGKTNYVFDISGFCFGVTIAEEIWHKNGPAAQQAKRGARLIININAAPYHCDKTAEREKTVSRYCIENNIYVCYTNLVGGQDELLFDGNSFLMDNRGHLINTAEGFKESLLITDIPVNERRTSKSSVVNIPHEITSKKSSIKTEKYVKPSIEQEVYNGLITGLRDYMCKNGFKTAVLGLSGGIDSSLVAAIAVDAMGKQNVIGVFMPSRYTSLISREDTYLLANNLGIRVLEISIDDIFNIYLKTLKPSFEGKGIDTTEENLQARIRGNILMALSNKFGYLVLITGNKSEMSVGYTTLYGDMAGGFGVIKDVYKTFVYRLSRYRNSIGQVIPERVITKAPTAELKPEQKDQDTLPPYEILDSILKEYIEKEHSYRQIIEARFDSKTVKKVLEMVDRNEYKRRQSPPGINLTPKAFGKDRRIPITNRYRLL